MNRIAIISPMFTGSILPLIKHFNDKGYHVDFYIITLDNHIINPEGWDCEIGVSKYGLNCVNIENYGSIISYLDLNYFTLYTLKLFHPYVTIPVLRNVMSFINNTLCKKIIKYLNSQKYIFVNLVGLYTNDYFVPFIKGLNTKVIVSLHEVCNHLNPIFNKPSKLIRYLLKNRVEIILHSEKSYYDILKYDGIHVNKLNIIKFGLFESYETINDNIKLNVPDNYLLYIGNINKYKGVDVLWNSMRLTNLDIQLVIAGGGYDDCLNELAEDRRITLFNRYLSNGEFKYLIKHCRAIVCPYRSSSQSGIPQVAFLYNKPIIASDIPFWKALLLSGKLGPLFKTQEPNELKKAIETIMVNDETINYYGTNIFEFKKQKNDSNWDNIVDTYINLFCK